MIKNDHRLFAFGQGGAALSDRLLVHLKRGKARWKRETGEERMGLCGLILVKLGFYGVIWSYMELYGFVWGYIAKVVKPLDFPSTEGFLSHGGTPKASRVRPV